MRAVLVLACALGLAACEARVPTSEPLTGANPARGKALIERFGCGSCHTIPGVRGANALVGPPLTGIRERVYVGGVTLNNADNLAKWIHNPRELSPKTAMPNVGASEAQARDMAAYLYSRK
jgi:cytochrome c